MAVAAALVRNDRHAAAEMSPGFRPVVVTAVLIGAVELETKRPHLQHPLLSLHFAGLAKFWV